MREKESNISMRIEELEDKSGVEVAGRGLLHLSVLMETMRREGFEFQVGRPRVLIKKDESGRKLEPSRRPRWTCPASTQQGHRGVRQRRRRDVRHVPARRPDAPRVQDSVARHDGIAHPSAERHAWQSTMFHHFSEYGPYRGEMNGRKNGSMISMSTEKSVAYALDALQERGRLFVGPGRNATKA